ncbi:MerR family transcriptional regulator [Paenibacillus selenitireducens]|uniref:MerR family transcriptional regulator n=1 Tax=Paenibacillus selenitireducens TaxID=1324314 RepID=A0A1T2XAJ7_9BACL|nr:MerR family transcriptional regulator [Paenibacillus selenitireducens]OPA76855.1 MerR family transcriptional regulator [Paenibacillus selenitireducens]
MNNYKIEEVSKECGLTKRTIRYYEELGLLFPPERSEGGYRLYSDKHIERLKQITNARDVLGVSLQEIQEFVTMSEEFMSMRQGIRETEDRAAKLKKIEDLEENIIKQRQLINQKLEKLMDFRNHIDELNQRVQEAKTKYQS